MHLFLHAFSSLFPSFLHFYLLFPFTLLRSSYAPFLNFPYISKCQSTIATFPSFLHLSFLHFSPSCFLPSLFLSFVQTDYISSSLLSTFPPGNFIPYTYFTRQSSSAQLPPQTLHFLLPSSFPPPPPPPGSEKYGIYTAGGLSGDHTAILVSKSQ